MDVDVIEYIFRQYEDVLESAIQEKSFFPGFLHEKIDNAWQDLHNLSVIVSAKSESISFIKNSETSILSLYGLTHSQWEYKKFVIDWLRDLFDKHKAVKILKRLLKAINVVLGSLFSASSVPGLEVMKEFKDFIEITILD